jgi:methylthioribose-1-phosphate isomerase
MNVNGVHYRSLWPNEDGKSIQIIDQTRLPLEFTILRLNNLETVAQAIRSMQVRGAPLIGAIASYGIALTMRQRPTDAALEGACRVLGQSRPTAVNLRWALERMQKVLAPLAPDARSEVSWREARAICEEDVAINRAIGQHGLRLLLKLAQEKRGTLHVMTHCNAGWLATVDYGTALAPIYLAHEAGAPVHVWVSETRPRNQGLLTAWELAQQGVAHTLITDSACGHLLQRQQLDAVIVGADRVTRRGDVANKIGTYMKALAARESEVPFYVASPGPSIDWTADDGMRDIPIEERSADEVRRVRGRGGSEEISTVDIVPSSTPAANPSFDVTPARLVSALITERGTCEASAHGLASLYPERIG